MKKFSIRTDQPGVVPTDILNDDSMKRIKARMDIRRPVSLDDMPKTAQYGIDEGDKVALTYGGNFKVYKDMDPTSERMRLGIGAQGEVVATTPGETEALVDVDGVVVEVPMSGLRLASKTPKAKTLRFASLNLIPKDFESLGTGMYRKGHSLWQVEQDGDQFVLVRTAEEKFETEGAAQEVGGGAAGGAAAGAIGAPPPKPPEQPRPQPQPDPGGGNIEQKKMLKELERGGARRAATDAKGKSLKVGDDVTAVLGGDPEMTAGRYRVKSIDGDSVEIEDTFSGEVSTESASELVKEASRRIAVDSTAKEYYKSYWKDYGKALTEDKLKLISPIIARAFFKLMGRTMPTELYSRKPDWNKLAQKYGNKVAKDVRVWIGDGIAQRRIAEFLHVSPQVALAWKPLMDMVGPKRAKALRLQVRGGTKQATLIASHTKRAVQEAYNAVALEGKAGNRKVAVDQAAKDYYKKYFGVYGDELTKDVKALIVSAPKG